MSVMQLSQDWEGGGIVSVSPVTGEAASERRGLTRRICADLDLAVDFTRCQPLVQGDGCRCWPLTSMEAAVVNPSTMRIGSERMRSDSPTSPNRQTRVSPQPDQHGGEDTSLWVQAVRLVGLLRFEADDAA